MVVTKFLWSAVGLTFLYKTVELLPKETFHKRSANDLHHCDNGWHYIDYYCYNIVTNVSSWENASLHCSRAGGHLASIHSEQQNDFITHLMKEQNVRNWWIGLHDPEWGNYVWEDGSEVDFSNCKTPESPNLCLMSGACIEMFLYAQGRIKGLWKDAECNATKSYVCQKRSKKYLIEEHSETSENGSSLCEEGWHQYEQLCYKLEKNSLKWEAASARCYSIGGYLASIHSGRQNDFLADLILKNLVRQCWIGLHDRSAEGYYSWDDGSDVDFTKWRPGEPSGRTIKTITKVWHGRYLDQGWKTRFSGDQTALANFTRKYSRKKHKQLESITPMDDCVFIDYAKHNGVSAGWVDSGCNLRKPYICQKQIPALSDGSTAITSTERKSPCEKNWMHNGNYCYALVRTPLMWHDASIYCGSMKANLTSIHSQKQQDFLTFFLMRKVTSGLWIGLHDSIVEANYTWVDGVSITYTNWARGEPSGYFSHMEDCVEMRFRPRLGYTGQWNDVWCSEKKYFICQKYLKEMEYTVEWKSESHGFVSVTTLLVIITFVIIFMAFLGAVFYYKRVWLEDKRLKLKTVLFRSSGTDTERLTEVDIKDNQNAGNEPYRTIIF